MAQEWRIPLLSARRVMHGHGQRVHGRCRGVDLLSQFIVGWPRVLVATVGELREVEVHGLDAIEERVELSRPDRLRCLGLATEAVRRAATLPFAWSNLRGPGRRASTGLSGVRFYRLFRSLGLSIALVALA